MEILKVKPYNKGAIETITVRCSIKLLYGDG